MTVFLDSNKTMKWKEYLRQKKRAKQVYQATMQALKILYEREWAKDHKRKAAGKH